MTDKGVEGGLEEGGCRLGDKLGDCCCLGARQWGLK